MAHELYVTVLDRQRGRRIPRAALRSFLDRVARALPPERPSEIAVCLVSDRRMRELNRDYRGRDRSTDVLSFQDGALAVDEGRVYLGDILVSVPTAARQARERGHSVGRELKRLVLHGYLHLLGYDHETDDGDMQRVERRLVRQLLDVPPRRTG